MTCTPPARPGGVFHPADTIGASSEHIGGAERLRIREEVSTCREESLRVPRAPPGDAGVVRA